MRARLTAVAFPVATVLIAFAIGGLVVVIAGANPFSVYRQLFVGAGFNWPFQYIPGNPLGVDGTLAEFNLISTIVVFTPLVLTGLAVALAFRCGLFNIGGQGQFWMGALAGFLVADHLHGTGGVVLAAVAGTLAGAAWGGIAGALKAFRGAHEVITTIMLNYIAILLLQYLIGTTGPLRDVASNQPQTATLPGSTIYPQIWGTVQGVHVGVFVALGGVVVYWFLFSRMTLGFELRATGLNADAAAYGGISVRRSIVLAMALAGGFAGLAGIGEVLGVSYGMNTSDVSGSQVAFTGIAVALLGRNTPLGVVLAALLFASLDSGARFLGGDFPSDLARSLATIIQGVIVLLVGGEQILRWALARRQGRSPADIPDALALPEGGEL
jgi:ABC-type uncharacterized transport system permease subunit